MKEKCPDLVFFMETEIRWQKMEQIRYKLGFHNVFMVDCIGKGEGLALLWGEDGIVEIQNFSQRHINVVIKTLAHTETWKFTGFYGQPDVSRRNESWSLLKRLAEFSPKSWVCMGDFSEIHSIQKVRR